MSDWNDYRHSAVRSQHTPGISAIYGERLERARRVGKTVGSRGVNGEADSGEGVHGPKQHWHWRGWTDRSDRRHISRSLRRFHRERGLGVKGRGQQAMFGNSTSNSGIGVTGPGETSNGIGVYGTSASATGYGVFANNPSGIALGVAG